MTLPRDLSLSAPIHGIDFTSAPRRAKPITVATGHFARRAFELSAIDELPTFAAFEAWLERPGPWIGGFDFPFGLPRETVRELGWPATWAALTQHCAALGRDEFRRVLDDYRTQRPAGGKYAYRRGDVAAGSHSPIKLVNPPVALMFLEGARRLVASRVSVPAMLAGDRSRIALEAYPGYAVRRLLDSRARVSYKNDAVSKQTVAQRDIRSTILRRLVAADPYFGFALTAPPVLLEALREDGRGDCLDAVLCAMQAAWGWQRRARRYALPARVDAIEGWIVTVPG